MFVILISICVTTYSFGFKPIEDKLMLQRTYDACKSLEDVEEVGETLMLSCINNEMYSGNLKEFNTLEEVTSYIGYNK